MSDFPIFTEAKWIRTGMNVPIEERPARIEDMINVTVAVTGGNVVFTVDALANKAVWLSENANNLYQIALDKYLMRRSIWTITATRICLSGSFNTSCVTAIKNATTPPDVYTSGQIYILPLQTWLLQSVSATDTGEGGKCVVTATWRSYDDWERVKVKE